MRRKSVNRFREIVKVLGSYGFGYIVDYNFNKKNKLPENLRKAFEELGPTFIKIGQILSTRPDLLSPEYIAELSKLQDNVAPENIETINKVFFDEFKVSTTECFEKFNEKPLASASISQVHKAILKDGREVVVKVQRPDISEKMKLDISILVRIVKLTKARFSDALIDPEEALHEILLITELELDFNNEAKNINTFKAFNKDVAFLYVPYVVCELCSTRVLTMERVYGFKVDDMNKLKSGHYDLDDLGKKLALSYLKQVLEDGFFHGDPHPGNIFVCEGKICFIDFGIMGSLSNSIKSTLNDMISAVAFNDINKMISALLSIGIKKGYVDRNKLYEDLDYLLINYLSVSLSNIQVSVMLSEIFDIAKQNNIRLPRDLTLLIRGLVILEGVIASIAPDIKIIDIAIPYVKANSKFSLLADLDLNTLLIRSYAFIKDSFRLPSKIIELSDSLISGRAKLQLEHKNLNTPINELNKGINRLVFGLIISSMIIGSSTILNSNIGPKIYNISLIGITGFVTAAFMAFCLLISIIKSGKL
ncbi:AarF/ABC1/UbiB kinase family protein [Clostridium tagluense]|uniref:ABC1 kinase family protein n=1 Tax=Clostridium tagluense TaxID=360422 RepID=UPI001CF102B2|nr:AarF/ABC1/UbiB kinase family protein [Clostridium tagluense]MCB2313619.1 AarF/ABC1/UbiB kinase family protein [Clostridium tagluense]MCB2318480.1 AarF/ABC1/UbiB kinase family protein [Clostridium tagluense]MCB2323284.1 AarF/ABC1/UbiB kinase family protein [Clostridium tagluense]MCB2328227.1 AarF/ABC1/UbiB kinase family protein [Clostridium tagluense]MCB2332986.1 AarF/ABC1/UbiB kinase family protein [Clostridium tagluense]